MNHSPTPASPLLAVAMKAVLWIGVPGVVIGFLAYSVTSYRSPERQEQERTLRELQSLQDKANAAARAQTQAILRQLEKDPVAIANEKSMAGMTPAQRAVRRNELEDAWLRKNGYR